MSQPDQPQADLASREVHKVELLISALLRAGVILSLFVVTFGLTLSFIHHEAYVHSHRILHDLVGPGHPFPRTIRQTIDGIRHFHGEAFITLGLLLLVATPVMRVAVSIILFLHERDRIFAVLTSIVLALLILSFFLGKVES